MTFDVTNPDKPTTTHDPEATLDYEWNLSGVIETGDTLDAATFQAFLGSPTGPVAPGAAISFGSISGTSVWGWLSISDITGTGDPTVPSLLGKTIAVTCHFTTAAGRIDDRTLYFKIKDR
jgi:hypothetical protein